MSKFNTTTKSQNSTPDTTNLAGGQAYSYDDSRKELASVILSSMVNGNSYYESEADRIDRIITMIAESDDKEFAAKAMVYVRNEGNLRSVSHIMGAILSETIKGSDFLRSALKKTMIRVDDMTEIVSLYNTRNPKKTIPNVLRRAMKDNLETRWDEYQFRKYQGLSNKVKLRDIVKLAHPKPFSVELTKSEAKDLLDLGYHIKVDGSSAPILNLNDDNSRARLEKGETFQDPGQIFKRIIEGNLKNIQTAQTVNADSTGESRAQNYFQMLGEYKLGYMAALKNLKNILDSLEAFDMDNKTLIVDRLVSLLTNEKMNRKSMILPFRFVDAYTMVENMSIDRFLQKKVLDAIETGFILSAKNINIVDENETVSLLLDESGSMGGWSSDNKSPFNIGKTLMASMLVGLDKGKALGYLWADNARKVNISGSPFDFMKRTQTQGYGTNLNASIVDLIKTKTVVDKLVIFTDMQSNSIGSFDKVVKEYRKISPNVKILFWNLQGYGRNTPMKLTHNILEVSGFSDKMLSVIPKMWKNENALIDEILAIEL